MRPVVMHFIWLGQTPLPRFAVDNIYRWCHLHPQWHFNIWSDMFIPGLWNQQLFEAAPNYGEKSDLLRYELLLQGGTRKVPDAFHLYADLDIIPLRNMEPLVEGADLLLGASRSWEGRNGMYLENALLGCVPGHPFMQTVVWEVARRKRDCPDGGTIIETGPRYLQQVGAWHFGDAWEPLHYPLARPTDYHAPSFRENVRVLPYECFYPNQHQGDNASTRGLTTQDVLDNLGDYPQCYGIHCAAGTWWNASVSSGVAGGVTL